MSALHVFFYAQNRKTFILKSMMSANTLQFSYHYAIYTYQNPQYNRKLQNIYKK